MPEISDLGGAGWRFAWVPRCPFDAPNVDDRADVAEWLPATVPGNVRTDLLALGRIPDPFFADWYQASLWVEDCDWWYRRAVDVSIEPDQRAFIVFDGVDYLGAVFVNGQELGRHQGMFSRQTYEVTHALGQPPVPIELAVRLWGSGALPRRRLSPLERSWAWLGDRLDPSGVGPFPDRMATVKCQMSFGWDFAPPIRSMGIWDDVWLLVTDGVFVEDVWIKSQLPDPTSRLAHLTVHVTVDSDRSRPARALVQVCPANFDGPAWGPVPFELDLPAGRSLHTLSLEFPNPQLWQPWDRGFPHLYELRLSILNPQPSGSGTALPVLAPNASVSDRQAYDFASTRFGIRDITLDEWTFTVNGQREFIRGVNWVPADSLPGRLRRDDYSDLLGRAQAAGVNLLRVWGGGLREKRAFYDLCDELGLLVWQEFPFACSFLGYFPRDAGWLGLVERECTAIVRAARNHPSLALWCGGNEFSPRRNQALVQTLTRVVEAHDGTRPFVPASPSPGDVHNWNVWHGKYPLHAYQGEPARFLSEFGLQAAPSVETLRGCLSETELWPPGAGWEIHKAELGKLWRYVGVTHSPGVCRALNEGYSLGKGKGSQGGGGDAGISDHLEEFVATSQRMQALGLQFAIERMRSRKGEAGGLCLWQFNEPWPAISWAILDYFRRPKLAYQRLKDLYNPVLVGLKFSPPCYRQGDTLQADIWAANDGLESLSDCRLLIELDSERIYEEPVTLPPDSVQVVGTLHTQFQAEPREIGLVLYQGDRIVSRNRYDLTYYDSTPVARHYRLLRWVAEVLLR
jgi:beta-mannosidase